MYVRKREQTWTTSFNLKILLLEVLLYALQSFSSVSLSHVILFQYSQPLTFKSRIWSPENHEIR